MHGGPRLRKHFAAASLDVVIQRAPAIRKVDVKLIDVNGSPFEICFQEWSGRSVVEISRRHDRGEHELPLQVDGDVLFESGERLRFALSPMSHVAVLDRHPTIWRDTVDELHRTTDVNEVLILNLLESFEVRRDRPIQTVAADRAADPPAEGRHLQEEFVERASLLGVLAPIDVEPGLDA